MDHHVIGVVGASGGLGASTLAVALAVRAGPLVGVTACVDGRPDVGGVDVTACVEHLPGLRWGDLADLRGRVDGAALLRALPGDGSLRVLAARGTPAGRATVRAVVEGLAGVCGLVVLDTGAAPELVDLCTSVVVLAGVSARRLADAGALVQAAALPADTHLVLRGAHREPVAPEDVAVHLDLPLAAVLRDDARVRADEDRARLPGSRARGAVETVADRLLALVGVGAGPGPAVPRPAPPEDRADPWPSVPSAADRLGELDTTPADRGGGR
ncbi:hypothetical protein [Phycicoccus sp. 3266]|uniref:hypothetical protein n=1 Tax=Phycicoccus sp. 3266 TaxID=2817751 RepID=UPI00285EED61|nr:hypothetical protein [Phycicoccus sp. 3266]MDR6863601.1 hypothetical protein [Phycicoccus sp. 3266]